MSIWYDYLLKVRSCGLTLHSSKCGS